MVEGQNLARSDHLKEAIAKFQKAKELDPGIQLEPDVEAKKLAIQSLKFEAQNQARADLNAAIASLKRANVLDPRLEPNPEADARKFASEGIIVEARNLASLGNTQDAIAAFRQATAQSVRRLSRS